MNSARIHWDMVRRGCRFQPPVSKSDAIRCLFLRFARGEALDHFTRRDPDDVREVRASLLRVAANDTNVLLDLGIGAAPFRFLLALTAMTSGRRFVFSIPEPLRRRPHGPLLDSLRQSLEPAGLQLNEFESGMVVDTTALKLGKHPVFRLLPSSSQYLSGLLLAGAASIARGKCDTLRIELLSAPESEGYAALTVQWLKAAGFSVVIKENIWTVEGFNHVHWEPEIPRDWSSAGYLLVWAWKAQGRVAISYRDSHPDASIIDHLKSAGLRIQFKDGMIGVEGELENGFNADAGICPDLIPTLAMLALAAPQPSRFANIELLRAKESDRAAFITEIATAAGGSTEIVDGEMIVRPAFYRNRGVFVHASSDHRRALAGSLLTALGWQEVSIEGIMCVNKSFPLYWETIAACGALLEER